MSSRVTLTVLSDFDDPSAYFTNAVLYFVIWRLVFGGLVSFGGNPFAQIYLGWWMVEVYFDRDGSWQEPDYIDNALEGPPS